MENINETFWRVFFTNRKVEFHDEVFRKIHHIIFPCEDCFDRFLHATTTEQMVSSAKEISSNILFSTSVSPSPAVYCGLIDAETNYPATHENEFISQDHVIHSVNVYLLGCYLFFNHPLLHDKLFDFFMRYFSQMESNIESYAILQFIDAWKVFSFCHDIGYPFEKLVNLDGIVHPQATDMFEYYRDLGLEIEFDSIIRSIAYWMFATVICERSEQTLESTLEKSQAQLLCCKWNAHDDIRNVREYIPQNDWGDYCRLYGIRSLEDLSCLYPFVRQEDVITLIRNNTHTIIGFKIGCGDVFVFLTAGQNKECYFSDKLLEYNLEFYCKKPSDLLIDRCIELTIHRFNEGDSWLRSAKYFAEPEVSLITNNKVDCRNTIHSIYSKLRNSLQIKKETTQLIPTVKSNFTPNMVDIVLEELTDITLSIQENDQKYRTLYNQIQETIQENLKADSFYQKVVQRIMQTIDPKLDRENAVCSIISYAFEQSHNPPRTPGPPKLFSVKKRTNKYICTLHPLDFFGKSSRSFYEAYKNIVSSLECYLKDMSIIPENCNISFLTDYTNGKTRYDHGIVGTHILLYSVAMENHLKEMWGYKIWCKNHANQKRLLSTNDAIIESLGAILVHNIYTKTYCKITGVSYKLTLDAHPLAYFGALCDALQIWDRHYSVDQSKCIIRNFNPSHTHVSLEIHGKKIVITCATENYKKSGENQRVSLDEYLHGAASLLKVNLIEEPV